MSELWCVRIFGPDDVYPCASRGSAELMASHINRKFGGVSEHNEILLKAVVEPWPWSAESHARGLDPEAPATQRERGGDDKP